MTILPFKAHAAAISGLRSTMQERVITPSDEGYEDRRNIWNGAINLHNPERLTAFGQ
jgi:hypothetical protein